MPGYNNWAFNGTKQFDPSLNVNEVISICHCNPSHYFEFSFKNVKINQITYDNGNNDFENDTIIGKSVNLSGIMADVSPTAPCAQIFSDYIEIENSIKYKFNMSSQSSSKHCIITEPFSDETTSANFEKQILIETLNKQINSHFIDEIKGNNFEIYFHLNHYIRYDNHNVPESDKFTGDVYGYIRESVPSTDNSGLRIKKRKLIAHDSLSRDNYLGQIFLSNSFIDNDKPSIDIEGSYDIVSDKFIHLRYLDFIPFLNREYRTPDINKYIVYIIDEKEVKTQIGEFHGTREEMLRSGGLLVFKLPLSKIKKFQLLVEAVKENVFSDPLMLESKWDIELETERGVKVPSGDFHTISATVYYNNLPIKNHKVYLYNEEENFRSSPIVASFEFSEVFTNENGRITPRIKAVDLCNANQLFDPVTKEKYDELPIDRNYGNYVYLSIDNENTKDHKEIIEIPVRVLHKVSHESIVSNEIKFKTHVLPLISYYIRYYPWIHVIQNGEYFKQFLDLTDYKDVVKNIDIIINYLSKDESDPKKMPRSRDFPIGGLELVKKWKIGGLLE